MENGFLNPRANTAFEEKFGCPSFVAFWMEAPATFPHLLGKAMDKLMPFDETKHACEQAFSTQLL